MPRYILAIDQGTTSSRALLFDADGRVVATAQRELPQILSAPTAGSSTTPRRSGATPSPSAARRSPTAGAAARDVAAIGITNQRETTVLWDRATGRPVHRAIVWQDRRTADACRALQRRRRRGR